MSDVLNLALAFAGILAGIAAPFVFAHFVSRDSNTDREYAHLRGERS